MAFFFLQHCSLLWQCHASCISICISLLVFFFFLSALVHKGTANAKQLQFPFLKNSFLAICYHHSSCLKLYMVAVFLICSQLQEAHKIKTFSFTYVMLWHTTYICASAVLPLVFYLQMCATLEAKLSTLTFNFFFIDFCLSSSFQPDKTKLANGVS